MMYKFSFKIVLLFSVTVLFSSCLSTLHFYEDEQLYTGAKIVINEGKKSADDGKITGAISSVVYPETNKKFLMVIPIKLWIYNLTGKPLTERRDISWIDKNGKPIEEKGFKKWVRDSWGQEPVWKHKVFPKQVILLMENRLHNIGYFHASVKYTEQISKWNRKKFKYVYHVTPDSAFRYTEINYPEENSAITQSIGLTKKGSLIKVGDAYNLSTLRAERDRIDKVLKESGYFYFSPDFIIYKIDSSSQNTNLKLKIELKQSTPEISLNPYKINEVTIHQNFTSENKVRTKVDTILVDNYRYIRASHRFKPKTITNAVFFEKNKNYSTDEYNETLKQLSKLNVFKYLKIDFKKVDSTKNNLLDVDIYLIPAKRNSINFELNYITKSTNFAGPGLAGSYVNRNIFGGAEKFTLKLGGNFESQFSGQTNGYLGTFSYEFSTGAELVFPRFYPFSYAKQSRRFVPKTKINIDWHQLNQIRYYQMYVTNLSYGYQWDETQYVTHSLNLVNLTYQYLNRATTTFDSILAANSLLKRSFDNQFMLGSIYSYTYYNLIKGLKRNSTYFNGSLDLSGNLLRQIQTLTDKDPNLQNDLKIFRNSYAEYAKVSFDLRRYIFTGDHGILVGRLFAGCGVPTGNSTALPFIKQYFTGGANSVRAMQVRSIGPGSYRTPADSVGVLIDKTGDIKLESNIEYRLKWGMYELAFFTDAGNIWLFKNDSQRPGGVFNSNTFYKEIAIGSGIGFRLDVEFFVARVDIAMPLRRPDYPETSRWIFQNSYGSDWKPTINIAIGYPF